MDIWPPKYWKFQLRTEDDPAVEIAFTDPRRFGRVRLVDAPGDSIRKASPLVENGPDPVVDSDLFTEDYLRDKMRSRHVPVKALILDQAMISGIGNWVGDEVLYHAKLHPEQYCDDFDDEQIHALYESIRYVCTLAVEKLGDSDAFPDHWLFNHRWGKGTKTASSHLPNGQKLAFLTVGGRTSCFAPSVQKKTGRLVRGVKEEAMDSDADGEASTAKGMRDESEAGINVNGKAMKKRKSANAAEVKCDAKISKIIASKTVGEADSVPGETPAPKGKSLKTTQRKSRSSVKEKIRDPENLTTPRRSGRLQGRSEFFED